MPSRIGVLVAEAEPLVDGAELVELELDELEVVELGVGEPEPLDEDPELHALTSSAADAAARRGILKRRDLATPATVAIDRAG